MKTLQTLLDTIESLSLEIETWKKTEAAAKEEISRAARSGSFKREIGKLGEASTLSALAPERAAKLEADRAEAQEQLTHELRRVRDVWNRFVQDRAAEQFDAFIALANPFFGGKEKERITRQEFRGIHIPAIAEIQRCGIDLGDFWKFGPPLQVKLAKQVIARIESACKERGWKFDEDATPLPNSPVEAKTPGMVRVRAREALPGHLFGKKPHLVQGRIVEPAVKAGEILTVGYNHYHALSRYLERLDDEGE